jgi:hypothetical protein
VCSFDLLRGRNLVHFKFQVFIKSCIEGEFCLCLHDFAFYTSCMFLSFDHKYFVLVTLLFLCSGHPHLAKVGGRFGSLVILGFLFIKLFFLYRIFYFILLRVFSLLRRN